MSGYEEMKANALSSELRPAEPEPAVVIDSGGTSNHDDALSYVSYTDGTLGRRVHIIDLPGLVNSSRGILTRTYDKFSNRNHRLFPPELTSNFGKGDIVPTITFERRFNPRTGEVLGFRVYKSKIKIVDQLSMMDVDNLFDKPKDSIRRAIALDPELCHLLDRPSANGLGKDIIREILYLTNLSVLHWAHDRGVTLIKAYMQDGRRYFFPTNELISDATTKVTNPIRNFLAFVNLSLINSFLIKRRPPYNLSELDEIAEIANAHEGLRLEEKQQSRELYPRATNEEVDEFLYTVFVKKDFPAAKKMLVAQPSIGTRAIHEVANNKLGFLQSRWQIADVIDKTISIAGVSHIHTQVVIISNGVEYRTPIKKSLQQNIIAARGEGAYDFWKRYFKNEDFSKSFWEKQTHIDDYKREIDEGRHAAALAERKTRDFKSDSPRK